MAEGYQRVYRLEFEDPSFDGLVVRMYGCDIDTLTRLQDLMTDVSTDERMAEWFETFGPLIKEWNLLDRHGNSVGTTPARLRKADWSLLGDIAVAYVRALTGVSRPLSKPSSDGDPLAELNLTMEPLSENPPSSSTPSESSDSA